jgi:hypothetical protein
MYFGLHVKCPLFLSDFNKIWISWTDFPRILKYHISWKSVDLDPCCYMRTQGLTDTYVTKLIVVFRNFVKAPKSDSSYKKLLTSTTTTLILFYATTKYDPFYPPDNCGHILKQEILLLIYFDSARSSKHTNWETFRTIVSLAQNIQTGRLSERECP